MPSALREQADRETFLAREGAQFLAVVTPPGGQPGIGYGLPRKSSHPVGLKPGGRVIRAHPEALRNFPVGILPFLHLPNRLRADNDVYYSLDMDNPSGGRLLRKVLS